MDDLLKLVEAFAAAYRTHAETMKRVRELRTADLHRPRGSTYPSRDQVMAAEQDLRAGFIALDAASLALADWHEEHSQ